MALSRIKINSTKCIEAQSVTVSMPLEDIKEERRKRSIELLHEDTPPDDPRLIKAIRDHFIDPPSQLMEKMSRGLEVTPQAKVIDQIFQRKKGGFYIECGAMDGERSSNSIYFEKKLNWRGILIEADRSFYRQLQGKNRKAYSINACLSPQQYPLKMKFAEASDGRGQLSRDDSSKHVNHVYCFPLYFIMLALDQTHIDYLSLDVEGFELDILNTIPFDKLDITTLSVEYSHAPNGGQPYLDFMNANGYKLNKSLIVNQLSVHDYIFVKKSFM